MPPPSTRLVLVRHGEVDAAWRGRIYGCADVPLSERGRSDAARVAGVLDGLELGAVISSGLARTEHAAACLRAARRLERLVDPDLRELERGDWTGLTLAELETRSPGAWDAWFRTPSSACPPRGESLSDLLRRVLPRADHWSRLHAGGAVALVTHGWVVRVLVCHALGASLDLAPRLDVRTGDVTILRWPAAAGRERAELEAFALAREAQLSE